MSSFPRSGNLLAIDLGTSGPKVALVSAAGTVLHCVSTPTALHLLPGGGAEQDPGDWWRAIVKACQRLREHDSAGMAQVVAVGCTAQWSGTVAVDARGTPLRPALIWMDSRGAPQVDRLVRGWFNVSGYGLARLARWVRLTGGAPTRSGKDSLAHLLYLKHQEPEVYRDTHCFLEPKDWLNHRLCGRFAATTDSITLHWVTDNRDVERITYHDGLLRTAGLGRAQLPELVRAHAPIGQVSAAAAAELGIPAGAVVAGGTPDMQSAALGSGAIEDYAAHLYIGTSSWISCHVPFKKTDLLHNLASLPSALPGRYFVAATQECAGVCAQRFLEHFVYAEDALDASRFPADAYARLDAAVASTSPGADGVVFTPWLYGERAPVEDRNLRGGFHHLDLGTTRRHLARAVYEGVAQNTRWLLHHVESFIGRRIERLRLIGGGARSAVWCQILADVLDRPIAQLAAPLEANVRGAAMLAAAAAGIQPLGPDTPAPAVEIAQTFMPQAGWRSLYDRQHRTFLEIYRRHRTLFAASSSVVDQAG